MEPELIVVEEGSRFWIVDQRWGYQGKYTNTLGYLPTPDYTSSTLVPHTGIFEAGYIWRPMDHYQTAYRQWTLAENRRKTLRSSWVYIVEARNKRQVVEAMKARGIITMFNQKWIYPNKVNKETTMYESTSEARLRVLERRQALLDAEILKEIERQERMARFGKDSDYPDETVLTWNQRYEKNGQLYTFVALKVAGRWYTTSTFQRQSWSWEALVEEYLAKAEGDVYIVSEWKAI
jgi:hypothetical protein